MPETLSFYQIQQSITAARETLRNADRQANEMAKLIVGRLRHVDGWVLDNLKRELRDFNMHTRSWKGND